MLVLILGLTLFLGVHSVRIYADDWRNAQFVRLGEPRWKGLYSLVSLVGFVAIIWGYGEARLTPTVLWATPKALMHLAGLLTLATFILLVAAYVPGNPIKAAVKHPMVLGVKIWALAHLLANNTVADLVLFGSFLIWAVLDYRSSRQRDARLAGTAPQAASSGTRGALMTVVVGTALWGLFFVWGHQFLIGVRPY